MKIREIIEVLQALPDADKDKELMITYDSHCGKESITRYEKTDENYVWFETTGN